MPLSQMPSGEPLSLIKTMLPIGGLTAITAAVFAFWGQIKGFIQRFNSLLVINASIEGDAREALQYYLWEKFKRSPLGSRSFTGDEKYVRPLESYNVVAFEKLGGDSVLTFFQGWKPLFVSSNSQKNSGGMSVSFVRGMFNLEQLLIDAVDDYNYFKKENEKKKGNRRYRTRKLFGRYGKDTDRTLSDEGVEKGYDNRTSRPLKWDFDDLGSPMSEAPFSNLFYSGQIDKFLEELEIWKKSEKYFKSRGLPWRLGACLEGPPGTGKTSFVRAVGQKFDIPIDAYDLISMSNEELTEYWRQSLNRAPVIVLIEDIDRIFDKDQLISQNDFSGKGKLTMDGLLNCISGVDVSDGVLIFVTCNDLSKLDSALGIPDKTGESTRPGRLDRLLHFGELEATARVSLANVILKGLPEKTIAKAIIAGDGYTGAQFQKMCSDIAVQDFWKNNSLVDVDSTVVQQQLTMN